jgi:hypothetical protein
MATIFAVAVIVGVSASAAWLARISLRSVVYVAPTIEGVFARRGSSLLDLPGVLSVDIGEADGVKCIVVCTRGLTELESSCIPAKVDGWEVRRQTLARRA